MTLTPPMLSPEWVCLCAWSVTARRPLRQLWEGRGIIDNPSSEDPKKLKSEKDFPLWQYMGSEALTSINLLVSPGGSSSFQSCSTLFFEGNKLTTPPHLGGYAHHLHPYTAGADYPCVTLLYSISLAARCHWQMRKMNLLYSP